MRFLIAYDIADPKRLRRVARLLERHAGRTQKSVFVFEGTWDGLRAVMRQAEKRMKESEDVIAAWPIATTTNVSVYQWGRIVPSNPAGIVLEATEQWFITED